MPELPSVETFKNYLNSTAISNQIENVNVTDEAIIDGSAHSFQMRLKDETLRSASRHGKYLFVELDRDEVLLFHFGMTGEFSYYKNEEDAPEYAKVIFNLKNGYKLAFICPRKFGKVLLIDSKEDFIKEKEMGPDAYSDDFEWEDFKEAFKDRRGKIKSTLMNQKILAGIGNVFADEILFQAGIFPFKKVSRLDEEALKEIYKKMNEVMNEAVEKSKDDDYPDHFLLSCRKEGAECPKCGGEIVREELSGRSTYYCKKHQQG